jgi:hypothetical protein
MKFETEIILRERERHGKTAVTTNDSVFLAKFQTWLTQEMAQIRHQKVSFKCGLRGTEEVDEAEDYEAPGSNPGQEL